TIPGTAEDVAFFELVYSGSQDWFASFDALYVGDQYTNNANSVINDSYVVTNLRLGKDIESGSMQISPFIGINNLFDESYNANVRINAFGGRFFEPAPDRNFYAGVTMRFNR
ncbi:MAG TPA: TonB-dependent receptor, partial [Gammaproteobacteria bacterium]